MPTLYRGAGGGSRTLNPFRAGGFEPPLYANSNHACESRTVEDSYPLCRDHTDLHDRQLPAADPARYSYGRRAACGEAQRAGVEPANVQSVVLAGPPVSALSTENPRIRQGISSLIGLTSAESAVPPPSAFAGIPGGT